LQNGLAQSACEVWPWPGMGVIYPRLAFVGEEFSLIFCFFIKNFCYRYASKEIKGSKDSDVSLESNQLLNQKNCPLSRGLRPEAIKSRKRATIMMPPTENPKPKMKKVFKVHWKTCRIRRGF